MKIILLISTTLFCAVAFMLCCCLALDPRYTSFTAVCWIVVILTLVTLLVRDTARIAWREFRDFWRDLR